MLSPVFRIVLIASLLAGPLVSSVALGVTPYSSPWLFWRRSSREHVPYGVSVGTPGPQRYPQYADGNYPWYGYGLGVPTYNWGYFGANGHGTLLTGFRGYHGNFWQWGYQRGY